MSETKDAIFLQAGDYCFDQAGTKLHTILGSCIAITIWHPIRKIGGMCHFALSRPDPRALHDQLDGRYAEDCMQLFKQSVLKNKTRFEDYDIKIFGGGNINRMYASKELNEIELQPVGEKNTTIAFNLLMQQGLDIKVAHVGEFGHRHIVFDITSGDVWVKFSPSKLDIGDVRSLGGNV